MKMLTFQFTLMTIQHKHTENFQIRFRKNLNVHSEIYLNGFLIMQWRQIQTNVVFCEALILTLKYLLAVLTLKIHIHKTFFVTINGLLNVHDHVSNLCKKASAKIKAMASVFPSMLLSQRKPNESHLNVSI